MIDNLALQIAIHVFIHATFILTAAWVTVRCLSSWPAASKQATWTTVFAVMLLLPVAYGTLPGWEVGLIPPFSDSRSEVTSFTVPPLPLEALLDDTRQDPVDKAESDLFAFTPQGSYSSSPDETSGMNVPLIPVAQWLSPAFLLIWAAGVLLLLSRLGLGMIWLRKWKQHTPDIGCDRLARQLARQIDLARPFKVLGSPKASVPIVWGVFSPVIILPDEAKRWPQVRLKAVLLHELAHLKRWDYLTHLLGRVARAFFWPNPLIWKALKRSVNAQEQACDDVALRNGVAPWVYAEQLLAVVKGLQRPSPAEAVAMNAGIGFKVRMHALLYSTASRRTASRWEIGAISLTGALLLAATSAFHVGYTAYDHHDYHWIEAESVSMPSGFELKHLENGTTSPETFVVVTDRGNDSNDRPETDPLVYSFETSQAGPHVIWARMRVLSAQEPFWIQVDSTRWIRWSANLHPSSSGYRWQWVQVRDADRGRRPVAFDLADGVNELRLARREAGVEIDQLLVTTDWNFRPAEAETPPSADKDHRIWLEAEEGEISAPLHVANVPDVSGQQYIEAPSGKDSRSSPPETGHAMYSFTISQDGTYSLWGRVLAESNSSDSFWVRMNEGPWIRWNGIEKSDQWLWDELQDFDNDMKPVRFELPEGTHRLTIAYRESNTKLDRILLTDNPTYQPRGLGELPPPRW